MDRRNLEELLLRVKDRKTSVDDAVEEIATLPYEAVEGMAVLDHHRELRSGVPEVVYGENKTPEEIAHLLSRLAARGNGALATRVAPAKWGRIREQIPACEYRERSQVCIAAPERPRVVPGRGTIYVVSAGTSDEPVAEEAYETLRFLGHPAERISDVGVAGLHRILTVLPTLRTASTIVCVAGMEGALPQVVNSLVEAPVVAVPTSVGYGVGIGGQVAMLSMLTACSPGLVVVNIDNGFGAAVAAARINKGQS